MRVNVYAAEITRRVEIVETNVEETGATFVGVRFFLESADVLVPPQHPDDDSSAVTFWVKSPASGFKPEHVGQLVNLFQDAAETLTDYASLRDYVSTRKSV